MVDFIFSQGIWLGEGKITLSTSPESVKFYMKWDILSQIDNQIRTTQIIQIQGIQESMVNHYIFINRTAEEFDVVIENQIFGQHFGKGTVQEKIICWQFEGNPTFEGTETYKKLENGELFLQAEYGKDQYRTIIEGIIWKKFL